MAIPMPKAPETLEQIMPSLTDAFIEAFNRGDVEVFRNYCTEDALMLMPDRPPTKGRPALEALLQEYADAKTKIVEIEPIETLSLGELGYATGSFRMETPTGGGRAPIAETGKFVTVYRHQADGSWKVVVDSLIRDAATQTA